MKAILTMTFEKEIEDQEDINYIKQIVEEEGDVQAICEEFDAPDGFTETKVSFE